VPDSQTYMVWNDLRPDLYYFRLIPKKKIVEEAERRKAKRSQVVKFRFSCCATVPKLMVDRNRVVVVMSTH
jgi:hypothetical protein